MATTMELDPLFVKALRLLHSKNKDSIEQLKQMVDEALDRLGGEDGDKRVREDSHDSSSLKSSTRDREATESKKRESEKRHIEKLQQDLAELSQEVPAKKARLDTSESHEEASARRERDAERRETERIREKAAKEREREKMKDRENREELTKEQERERDWEHAKKAVTPSSSDTESEKDAKKEQENENMDVDDFALFQGIACVVCKQFDVSSGNQLVECQECHSLYHQDCHRPPVVENNVNDPRFVWYCSKCMKNLKKTAAAKVPKTKTSAPPPARETANSRATRIETSSIQPFKRLEPSKPSMSKEGVGSSGRPLMGLASLAANLSSKDKHSKPVAHKSAGSSSTTRPETVPRKTFTSSSLLKPDLPRKESSKSATSSKSDSKATLGLGALARPDLPKAATAAKRDVKPGQSLLKPTPISSSSAFAQSSFGAALTSGLPKVPSGSAASAGTGAGGGGGGASGGKMSQSSMVSADKRLQMMKKKAAAKLHEKRTLPK